MLTLIAISFTKASFYYRKTVFYDSKQMAIITRPHGGREKVFLDKY
jgi:hypothetical protein